MSITSDFIMNNKAKLDTYLSAFDAYLDVLQCSATENESAGYMFDTETRRYVPTKTCIITNPKTIEAAKNFIKSVKNIIERIDNAQKQIVTRHISMAIRAVNAFTASHCPNIPRIDIDNELLNNDIASITEHAMGLINEKISLIRTRHMRESDVHRLEDYISTLWRNIGDELNAIQLNEFEQKMIFSLRGVSSPGAFFDTPMLKKQLPLFYGYRTCLHTEVQLQALITNKPSIIKIQDNDILSWKLPCFSCVRLSILDQYNVYSINRGLNDGEWENYPTDVSLMQHDDKTNTFQTKLHRASGQKIRKKTKFSLFSAE